jgi:hypothetical protein
MNQRYKRTALGIAQALLLSLANFRRKVIRKRAL